MSTSYRAVVPLSLLVGAGFLVLADVLARTVLSPAELPIGVVTAFFGAPFFAVVLRTSRMRRDDRAASTSRFGSAATDALRRRLARGRGGRVGGADRPERRRARRRCCARSAGSSRYAGAILLDGVDVADARPPRARAARRVRAADPGDAARADACAEYVLLGRTPYIGYFGAEGRDDRLAAERALERLELRDVRRPAAAAR